MAHPSNYYTAHQGRLLRDFDSYIPFARDVLAEHFGASAIPGLVQDARQEYARLIPQLPYIGGKQPFTQFITNTGLLLAVFRSLRARGKSTEEAGQLIYRICERFLQAYPGYIKQLVGYMNFSWFYRIRLRKRAHESQLRRYTGDYVFDYVEGDGRTFDYGVDYRECASCKFLEQQDAMEFAPYLCPVDVLYSQALGWGLSRTTTLAEGGEKCDFRFKKGGPTIIRVPRALEPYVNDNQR